jgi:toluene monooxygenase system ferredoxin subunit
MTWHDVIEESELLEGDWIQKSVGPHTILLVSIGGTIKAYNDRCPHQASSLGLGEFDADEDVIICAAHRWEFRASTGESLNPKGHCLVEYPTRIEKGLIQVAFDAMAE